MLVFAFGAIRFFFSSNKYLEMGRRSGFSLIAVMLSVLMVDIVSCICILLEPFEAKKVFCGDFCNFISFCMIYYYIRYRVN